MPPFPWSKSGPALETHRRARHVGTITRSHYMLVSTPPLPLGQSVQTNRLSWNAVGAKQGWKRGKWSLISLQNNVDAFIWWPSPGRRREGQSGLGQQNGSFRCCLCGGEKSSILTPPIQPLFHQALLWGRRGCLFGMEKIEWACIWLPGLNFRPFTLTPETTKIHYCGFIYVNSVCFLHNRGFLWF